MIRTEGKACQLALGHHGRSCLCSFSRFESPRSPITPVKFRFGGGGACAARKCCFPSRRSLFGKVTLRNGSSQQKKRPGNRTGTVMTPCHPLLTLKASLPSPRDRPNWWH